MLSTIQVKLLTTDEQYSSLLATMWQFNHACNYISDFVWDHKIFGKVEIQRNLYKEIRKNYGLSAQMTVRAVGKVSESYRINKENKHFFKHYGAIVYDQRILSFKSLDLCSILTLKGRAHIKMVCGGFQPLNISRVRGQADLVLIKKTFYLMVTVEIPEKVQYEPKNFIGIDFGIVNLATTSEGKQYVGDKCLKIRQKYSYLRAKLQSVGTWDAKKHLKRLSKKERQFKKSTNHLISKQIVFDAKGTQSGIAIENLKGIRERDTVRCNKDNFNKWAFGELAKYIIYKARLNGVPVIKVNPKNTSRECSCCGYVDKNNRKSQEKFKCIKCGYVINADINAAKNIASRAAVNQPIALRPV